MGHEGLWTCIRSYKKGASNEQLIEVLRNGKNMSQHIKNVNKQCFVLKWREVNYFIFQLPIVGLSVEYIERYRQILLGSN